MALKAFLSYASRDSNLVRQLKYGLEQNKIGAYMFEGDRQPGMEIEEKLAKRIDESDLLVVFWTREGSRSTGVRWEIDYAKRKGRMVMPIVEEGVPVSGWLARIENIALTREEPYTAIAQVGNYLVQKRVEKEWKERSDAILGLVLTGLLYAVLPGKGQITLPEW